MPYIPPELVANILAHLDFRLSHRRSRNRGCKDLEACSLVCRSWTPFAQTYLFHSISITSQADLEQLKAKLDDHEHLCSLVRCLHLDLHPEATPAALSRAHIYSKKLINVTRLELWMFHRLHKDLLHYLANAFPDLRELFYYMPMTPLSQHVMAAQNFTSLQTLEFINSLRFHNADGKSMTMLSHNFAADDLQYDRAARLPSSMLNLNLRSVALGGVVGDAFVRWIIQLDPPVPIEVLQLENINPLCIRLINSFRNTLQTLNLYFDDWQEFGANQRIPHIDLTGFTNLRRVHYEIRRYADFHYTFPRVENFIASLPSGVEEVSLAFRYPSIRYTAVDWDAVDISLAQRKPSGLRDVCILLEHPLSELKAYPIPTLFLPRCHALRVLTSMFIGVA